MYYDHIPTSPPPENSPNSHTQAHTHLHTRHATQAQLQKQHAGYGYTHKHNYTRRVRGNPKISSNVGVEAQLTIRVLQCEFLGGRLPPNCRLYSSICVVADPSQ